MARLKLSEFHANGTLAKIYQNDYKKYLNAYLSVGDKANFSEYGSTNTQNVPESQPVKYSEDTTIEGGGKAPSVLSYSEYSASKTPTEQADAETDDYIRGIQKLRDDKISYYDTQKADEDAYAKLTYDQNAQALNEARQKGIQDADTSYQKQLSTYGRNAEALGRSGLAGSGYSDYLQGNAYAQGQANKRAVISSVSDALNNAELTYQEALRQNNSAYNANVAQAKFDAESDVMKYIAEKNEKDAQYSKAKDDYTVELQSSLGNGDIFDPTALETKLTQYGFTDADIDNYLKQNSNNALSSVTVASVEDIDSMAKNYGWNEDQVNALRKNSVESIISAYQPDLEMNDYGEVSLSSQMLTKEQIDKYAEKYGISEEEKSVMLGKNAEIIEKFASATRNEGSFLTAKEIDDIAAKYGVDATNVKIENANAFYEMFKNGTGEYSYSEMEQMMNAVGLTSEQKDEIKRKYSSPTEEAKYDSDRDGSVTFDEAVKSKDDGFILSVGRQSIKDIAELTGKDYTKAYTKLKNSIDALPSSETKQDLLDKLEAINYAKTKDSGIIAKDLTAGATVKSDDGLTIRMTGDKNYIEFNGNKYSIGVTKQKAVKLTEEGNKYYQQYKPGDIFIEDGDAWIYMGNENAWFKNIFTDGEQKAMFARVKDGFLDDYLAKLESDAKSKI